MWLTCVALEGFRLIILFVICRKYAKVRMNKLVKLIIGNFEIHIHI